MIYVQILIWRLNICMHSFISLIFNSCCFCAWCICYEIEQIIIIINRKNIGYDQVYITPHFELTKRINHGISFMLFVGKLFVLKAILLLYSLNNSFYLGILAQKSFFAISNGQSIIYKFGILQPINNQLCQTIQKSHFKTRKV